jgi:hypothetical protein
LASKTVGSQEGDSSHPQLQSEADYKPKEYLKKAYNLLPKKEHNKETFKVTTFFTTGRTPTLLFPTFCLPFDISHPPPHSPPISSWPIGKGSNIHPFLLMGQTISLGHLTLNLIFFLKACKPP